MKEKIQIVWKAAWVIAIVGLVIVAVAGDERTSGTATSERYQIAEAALRFEMSGHSGSRAEHDVYSAYVIEKGEFTSQLVAAFAGFKPRVVADIEVSTDRGYAIDKASGKPVKLWSVNVTEIKSDHAIATVGWYSGTMAASSLTLHLIKKEGRWVVESEKTNWIS